jgi:hypothetical protein
MQMPVAGKKKKKKKKTAGNAVFLREKKSF